MIFMCPSSHIGHTNLKKIGKRLRYVSVYLIFWCGSQIFLSIKKKWKTILAPVSQVLFITEDNLLKRSFEVDIILGYWRWTRHGNPDWTGALRTVLVVRRLLSHPLQSSQVKDNSSKLTISLQISRGSSNRAGNRRTKLFTPTMSEGFPWNSLWEDEHIKNLKFGCNDLFCG